MKHASSSLLLVLCACAAVGDDYVAPPAPLPESWSSAQRAEAPPVEQWWSSFDEPQLAELIERAQARNVDLAAASASVREARAALGVTNAATGPSADFGAGFARSRQSLESRGGAPFLGERETSLWELGFDARWELDVFGGLRRELEAASADLQSAEELHRAVLVSLAAETARAYVELRGLQQRLAIVDARVRMQSDLSEIVRARADAGLASDLDAARAAAAVSASRAEAPGLQARIAERIHALSVLVGAPPRQLRGELLPPRDIPNARAAVFVDQPLELLRRRPDLRAAERRCAAASARAAAAFADRFPRISLGASFGWAANEEDRLLHQGALGASIGPSLSLPLFDSGARRARFEAATEREEQAVLAYQDAVLLAAKEVEDALAALSGATARRAMLQDALAQQLRAERIARELYAGGLADFLAVLDAERELFALQDQLATAQADCALQSIALAKALGGGWDPAQPPAVAARGAAR
jgi:NodT family efflux transporter outer membrane factor (OMF) lipoprotein